MDVRRSYARDLTRDNEIGPALPTGNDHIHATSFSVTRVPGDGRQLADLFHLCIAAALDETAKSPSFRWLFLGWAPTPFNRLQARSWFLPLKHIRPLEACKFERGGLVFALAEVATADVPSVANWCRNQLGLLLFTRCKPTTESEARALANSAFPEREPILDIRKVVLSHCSPDTIVIRCWGAFDDLETSVDLFHVGRWPHDSDVTADTMPAD